MPSASGTSVKGRQLLLTIPTGSNYVFISMRSTSIGHSGKLGWASFRNNTFGNNGVELVGASVWDEGHRIALGTYTGTSYLYMIWETSGILWTVATT